MLSFLTPEGAPNYRKLIISPKQVPLVANGVMDDFFYLEITPMYFFLFDLILYVPVNNLQLRLDGSSWVEGLMCLSQGHNAVTPVRLEKTSYRPAKLGHKQHM